MSDALSYTAPCPCCGVETNWRAEVVSGPRLGHLDTLGLQLDVDCDCDMEVAV